jgi:two-component system, OmpR family, sensor histidine kinase KdpD
MTMSSRLSSGSSTSPSGRGQLHVYLGAAPGVGKTYAMLAEANRLAGQGVNVVAALIETHDRADTTAMLTALERVPPRRVRYRGSDFDELDTDAVLTRHPDVVLVDELAHTCAPGSRHEKRWEDVEELLDAGIDVITSLNVQHIDSLGAAVETATGVAQHETVPDAVIAAADRIDFIDVTPDMLRARIADTDVLRTSAAPHALSGFFTTERLTALRTLAFDWLQQHHRGEAAVTRSVVPPQRIIATLTGAPEGEYVLRRAAQIAASLNCELIGVHVCEPSGLTRTEPAWLTGQRRILGELGGRYTELAGIDVARAVLDFARSEDAHQLVLGATRRSRGQELLHGSVINRAIRYAGPVEVHIVPARKRSRRLAPVLAIPSLQPAALPGLRRVAAWVAAFLLPFVIAMCLIPFRSSLGVAGALLCGLLAVVVAALLGGILPALAATTAGILLSDYYFTPPLHTLRVANAVDLVALITFGLVAIAVGGLVDLLTRQGGRAASAKAEAANLARLAAHTVAATADITDIIGSIRRAFTLGTVAVLRRTDNGWEVVASTGPQSVQHPDEADYTVELATGRFLVLTDAPHSAHDRQPLQAFLSELRLTRERAELATLEAADDNDARTG